MASEKQYLFFKSLYDEESAREKQLHDQAKNYLSLASLYSAFVLFSVERFNTNTMQTKIVLVMSVLFMLMAFLISLWATKVSDYEAVNLPRKVLEEEFGDEPLKDEIFFDNRIADYVVACERNSLANDRKAFRLKIAGYSLLLGIVSQAGYLGLRVL